MTRKEFDEFKKLTTGSRASSSSSKATSPRLRQFDLRGMDDAIAMLSGDRENVADLRRGACRVGDDPDVWLPVHLERVFETQAAHAARGEARRR